MITPVVVDGQTGDLGDAMSLQTGRIRTTFDRQTGRLVSTVETLSANRAGMPLAPVDMLVDILSDHPDRVAMPGARGGLGAGPYGRFYFNLNERFAGARFGSGSFAAQQLCFERNRYERFRYDPEPRGAALGEGPPVLALDPLDYAVDEGETLTIGMTASDPDGGIVALSGAPLVANATLSATNGPAASGTYAFTPVVGQRGVYAVTFTARDPSGLEDTKTVQITVRAMNHPPTISVPPAVTVREGDLIAIPLYGDDPDGDRVRLSAEPLPDNAIFIEASESITFAPDYSQSGVYDINCRAYDGQVFSTAAVVRITVQDVAIGSETDRLTLAVQSVENPTLLGVQRITGTVNTPTNLPPAQEITSALITGISPVNVRQAEAADVVLTGKSTGKHVTHFEQGLSSVSLGPGVSVVRVTVNSPWEVVARIVVAADADVGSRGVQVQTGAETAVAVPAFQVEEGRASLTGVLVDSDTGVPIVGATVSLHGTTWTAVTGADGSFTLSGMPEGDWILVVNPSNHQLLRIPVHAGVGPSQDLGELHSPATVYDPSQPASVSLHSVLGRGLGSLIGDVSLDEARKVVRDTFLLLGGDEVAVYDVQGHQINPEANASTALVNIRDSGIELYAERLAKGDSVGLMEVLYDLTYAFGWENEQRPTYLQLLNAMQSIVNEAWANPSDPNSAVPIAVFNTGRQMTPDPPILGENTRLSRMQAFLVVSGFIATLKNHGDEWLLTLNGLEDRFRDSSRGEVFLAALSAFLCGPNAYAQAPSVENGRYTVAWAAVIKTLGINPVGIWSSTGSPTVTEENPDMEKILRDYYMTTSPESLAAARELILKEMGPLPDLIRIFNDNPYGVEEALDELIRISTHDTAVKDKLRSLVFKQDGTVDLVQTIYVDWNATRDMMVSLGLATFGMGGMGAWLVPPDYRPAIITRSMAPHAPYIYLAREQRMELGEGDNSIAVPAAIISFVPSSDDEFGAHFYYRLWHIQGADTYSNGTLRLVAAGKKGDLDIAAPVQDPDAPGRLVFAVPLPPAGMNHYRIDAVNAGHNSVRAEDLAGITPWLSGYVDDPLALTLEQVGVFGKKQVQPGFSFVNGHQYRVSPLSNAGSVYSAGQGSGLSAFGRVDIAADYEAADVVYVSIPAADRVDRGSGTVFKLQPEKGWFDRAFKPGFMSPGQLGLAVDSKNNLYCENAASEASYGGKIFRFVMDAASMAPTAREFCGTVNYYSQMINRAHPVSVQQMVMGRKTLSSYGEELYVADRLDQSIKKIDVDTHLTVTNSQVPWHTVGKRWAWNSGNSTSVLPQNILNFGANTDLAFDIEKTRLFITQGQHVLMTTGGVDAAQAIATDGTLFTSASGCAVCEGRGDEYLFVSDRADGRILRIPLADIPVAIPSDPIERSRLMEKYIFLDGLAYPGQIRIIDEGRAMVYSDEVGLRYFRFGFVGRAENPLGKPLAGAQVVLQTHDSLQTAKSDAQGYYSFRGKTKLSAGTITVHHPEYSYSEFVQIDYRCGSDMTPLPEVLITNMLDLAIDTEMDRNFMVDQTNFTVHGTINPSNIDFTVSSGVLEITRPDGFIDSYPLVFTGNANEFLMENIPLEKGVNSVIIKTRANGILQPGSSLRYKITYIPGYVSNGRGGGHAVRWVVGMRAPPGGDRT